MWPLAEQRPPTVSASPHSSPVKAGEYPGGPKYCHKCPHGKEQKNVKTVNFAMYVLSQFEKRGRGRGRFYTEKLV